MREGRDDGAAFEGRWGGIVDVHTGVHRARRQHRCEVAVDVLCRRAAYGDGALTDSDRARAGTIRLGCPHAANVWRRPHEVAVGREVVPHEDGSRGRRRRRRQGRRRRRRRGWRWRRRREEARPAVGAISADGAIRWRAIHGRKRARPTVLARAVAGERPTRIVACHGRWGAARAGVETATADAKTAGTYSVRRSRCSRC